MNTYPRRREDTRMGLVEGDDVAEPPQTKDPEPKEEEEVLQGREELPLEEGECPTV